MSSKLSTFEKLKRKLYLYVIPLILIALFISLLGWNEYGFFERAILTSYFVVFSGSLVLIYRNLYIRAVELTIFCLISFFYLFLTYWALDVEIIQNHQDSIGDGALWTPMIYIYIFITFVGNLGIILSVVLWLMTTGIILFYVSLLPVEIIGGLINYQLAMFIYMIFLFFARNILKASTKIDMLEKMAFKDMLTGIDNRRAVHKKFEKLNKHGHPYSVIFFDIDHFKKINDQHGHIVGDSILIELANVIKTGLKPGDFFARWGGEEFIIISKKETVEKALQLAEKLKTIINEHQFEVIGRLTLSFGVAIYQPGHTAEIVLEHADQALYVAKETGRNTIIAYGQ